MLVCGNTASMVDYVLTHTPSPSLSLPPTRFITNKPMLVCGNTASMVGETWLAPHFTVMGDRAVHYGQFDCSGPKVTSASSGGAGDCAGGACC